MKKKPIYKQLFALFVAGFIGFTALGTWASVQAQVQKESQLTNRPQFINFKDADQLKLQGDGKPFKPSNLEEGVIPNESDTRGTIGPFDNRIPMLSRKYPWSAIGRVQGTTTNAKSYHCTGVLIDENLVLTNAHCVIDPETSQLSQEIRFMASVIDGDYKDVAAVETVIYGTNFKDKKQLSQNDWAILKINRSLGRKYGYLAIKPLPSTTLIRNQKKYFFVGYSGDFPNDKYRKFFTAGPGWTASYEAGCSIVKEDAGFLLHDCATAGGSSGGPIIASIGGEAYIVALNNAEIKDLQAKEDIINVAVKMDFFKKFTSRN